ncbi:TetR/AcrR family transcriptional regulator [Solidesulfovibrio sp.]|uniref:TetR/AcrR family transcriptional regulator n=1 Tax=Solidesulfovibrio sp. TaxID=2910990 RepID=UPI002B2145F7|nr:TetR/AcrR family transcriptional regulator [Solidesulfovibrio sp.]MEA5090177.1 TetR/AcrR family transcriptional regulator [Solidesulfovibrio sp.]
MAATNMREKILVAAAQLFAAEGYSAVSMRRIATAVGMTQANLYYYFKNKEELIRSVLTFVFSGRSRSLAAALESGADARQCLENGISWLLTLLFEDSVSTKLFFRELLTDDRDRLQFLTENVFQDAFDSLVRLLDAYLDTPDPVHAAIFLTSTVIGHRQFAGIVSHLHGAKPEHVAPQAVTRHLMQQLRRFARQPAVSS